VLFKDLELIEPLQAAVAKAGYREPTPIQQAAIPPALQGRDVLGCAQTGTGKTAAFSLPILQRIDKTATDPPKIRALILTPTRELAAQIGDNIQTYGQDLDLYHTVIFGGVNEKPQIRELEKGVDILVATPGRLLDLMNRGLASVASVEIFVLDEADRMLDMGFINDVRKITAKLPKKRQTLFFSATMPKEIKILSETLLENPVYVSVTPVSSTAEKIAQTVYFVEKNDKPKLLVDKLKRPEFQRVLVFSRTKHGANRIVQHLEKANIPAAAIHGNKSQGARTRALDGFRSGDLGVLVATDIAARGIDVDGVTHVINYDIPNTPETYVHRIGRTARAGREGEAASFCEEEERYYLEDIEKLIKQNIPRVLDHSYQSGRAAPPETDIASRSFHAPKPKVQQRGGGGGGGRGRSEHQRPRVKGGSSGGARAAGARSGGGARRGGGRPSGSSGKSRSASTR
jgi:ATP-dependent RNA helicase RhlE